MPRRARARSCVCVSALLSVLAAGEIMRAGGEDACRDGACAWHASTSRHGSVDGAGNGAGEKLSTGVWPLPCSLEPHAGFPAPSAFESRPFVVGSFLKWFDVQGFDAREIASCSTRCLFLHLPSGAPETCVGAPDLVLMTAAMRPPPGAVKTPWQLWGYYSLESPAIYSEMDSAAHMALFDLELSTRLSSHVPMTFAPRDAEVVRRALSTEKSDSAIALYLQGNCVVERDAWVLELMKHVRIDSLGKCLKNGVYPDNVGTVELISRYKFFIAFENSVATDFVTERVFNAWIAGAVPIYRGAPNIAAFAPAPHSYISADEFASSKELGEYLQYLNTNASAWREYLSFKEPATPLAEGYKRASGYSFYAPGGEAGASFPFAPAAMLDTSSPRMEGTSGASCRHVDALGTVVDEHGIPVLDPRSRCFDAHSKLATDHHRHNRVGACRVCEAGRAAQQALFDTHRLHHSSSFTPSGPVERWWQTASSSAPPEAPVKTVEVSLAEPVTGPGPVRILLRMSEFVVPDEGHIALIVAWEPEDETSPIRNDIMQPLRGPLRMEVKVQLTRSGRWVVTSQVVSLGRRVLSSYSLHVDVPAVRERERSSLTIK